MLSTRIWTILIDVDLGYRKRIISAVTSKVLVTRRSLWLSESRCNYNLCAWIALLLIINDATHSKDVRSVVMIMQSVLFDWADSGILLIIAVLMSIYTLHNFSIKQELRISLQPIPLHLHETVWMYSISKRNWPSRIIRGSAKIVAWSYRPSKLVHCFAQGRKDAWS